MRPHFGGIGSRRLFGLLGATALAALVAGCGLFDSTPQIKKTEPRPGAERNVPASSSLQSSGSGHQYDGDIRPVDESKPIGSVIADKGGQKKQLDAAAKDAAERDAKAREANAKRDAEAPVPPPIVPGSAPPAGAAPVPPLPGQETSAPVPPPGPVTSAPMPSPPLPGSETSAPLPPPTPPGTTAAPPPATTPTPATTQ